MGIAKYFNNILDVLGDGVYISDRNGITLQVNKAYERLTGLKAEELLGRSVVDLKNEGKFDAVLNPQIVETRKAKTLVQITKPGYKVILSGNPVFDSLGEVVLVVTFVRDVTALSQLKEQLNAQMELIENISGSLAQAGCGTSPLIMISRPMIEIVESLQKIARTDVTVLLLGETGVGKDVLACMLHKHSQRANQPFYKVDCTSIPENLVESELFGYDAGAFSGANRKGKPGLIEMADKGTLFLDEIGELPLAMQAKLLRVLQDQEIKRVGSNTVRKVDVRIVAATHRDLEKGVSEGSFRMDLYYRLCVAVLKVPPLRERKQDIVPLTYHFLKKFNSKYNKSVKFSKEAMSSFQGHSWPGNIREMENLIHNLVVTSNNDEIELYDLPNNLNPTLMNSETKTLHEMMSDFEKSILKKALSDHGSITEVASAFKADRVTIYRKMKKYGLA